MKRPVFLFVALAAFLSLQAEVPRYVYREKINPLLKNGRVEEAIAVIEKSYERAKHPEEKSFYLKEASQLVLQRLKDFERAWSYTDRMPEPSCATSYRMTLLGTAKKWDELTDKYGQTNLDTFPVEWQSAAYSARANAWLALKNYEAAEKDLIRTADLPGAVVTRGNACLALARVYRNELKDPEKAVQAYRRGIALVDSGYAWRYNCYSGLHDLLMQEKRFDEALALWEGLDKNVFSNPQWHPAMARMHAAALARFGRTGQAATLLVDALRSGEISEGNRRAVQADLDKLIENMWAEQQD